VKKHFNAFIAILLALTLCFSLVGCGGDVGFGEKRIVDPEEYGRWESYLSIPDFLPELLEGYRVNGYYYRLFAYMDICYEIFLDITVSEEQLNEILSSARANEKFIREQMAFYADGYSELVFEDYYSICRWDDPSFGINVDWADIDKIIYNEESLNVVFVCFHANDTEVYPLSEVEYFNRFNISEEDYVKNLKHTSNTEN
jgi:hypothetical protein